MLNFKKCLVFLLKELIYVFRALQTCLRRGLFLENIKKRNCKLCGTFLGLVWKNAYRVSWEDHNEICGATKEIDVK